ncbi:MAG: hypothetical protein JSS49_16760 [Planctomycetes bacterium]|nr:hypothetical protein [Planctomycetota bacterium]
MFDPYRKWLGIPPKDQPPNHYRLLGLELYENDLDVIEGAAERQMSFVRQYQSGEHAAAAARVLNELATARLCLLKPATKAAYDEKLRMELAPMEPEPTSDFPDLPMSGADRDPGSIRRKRKTKSGKTASTGLPPQLMIGGGIAAAVCVLLFVFVFSGRRQRPVENPQNSNTVTANTPDKTPAAKVAAESTGSANDPVNSLLWSDSKLVTEPVGPPVDLVTLVNLERDVAAGKWEKTDSALISDPGSRLYLPSPLPEDYQLKFAVRCLEGADTLTIGFMMGGRQGMVAIDGWGATLSGLYLDGREANNNCTTRRGRLFKGTSSSTIVLTVHPGHFHATFDGETIINWFGNSERMLLHPHCPLGSRESPFLCASNAKYVIESASLVPLKPEPALKRVARLDRDVDLLPFMDVDRDVFQGVWGINKGTLRSPEGWGKIYIPTVVPEEYTVSATVELPAEHQGNYGMVIGLVTDKSNVQFVSTSGDTGLDMISGRRWNGNETRLLGPLLKPGVPVRIACTVTRNGIRVEADDKTLIDWRGDFQHLSIDGEWMLPDARRLYLGAHTHLKYRDIKLGPPLPAPKSPDHPPLTVGKPLDLLALIDPTRDAFGGTWERDGTALKCLGDVEVNKLAIPFDMPEEYKLTMRVTRIEGGGQNDESMHVGLPFGRSRADLTFDSDRSKVSGVHCDNVLYWENPIAYRGGPLLPAGTPREIVIVLTKTGLNVTCEGTTVIDWRGNPNRFSVDSRWVTPGLRLSLGSWHQGFRFEKLELEPLPPTSFPDPPPVGADGQLLPLIDIARDGRIRDWKREGDGLICPAIAGARLNLPVPVPARYVLSAKVERTEGARQLNLGLMVGGHPCLAVIDADLQHQAGIDLLDSHRYASGLNYTHRNYSTPLLPTHQTVQVKCLVLPDTILVTCDDQEVIRWHGDPRRLSMLSDFVPPNETEADRNCLWLGSWESAFRFRDLELKPLTDAEARKLSDSFTGVFPATSQTNVPLATYRDAASMTATPPANSPGTAATDESSWLLKRKPEAPALLLMGAGLEQEIAVEACRQARLPYDMLPNFPEAGFDYSRFSLVVIGSNMMDYWGAPERKDPAAFRPLADFVQAGGHLMVFNTFNGRNMEHLQQFGILTGFNHLDTYEMVPGVSEIVFDGLKDLIPAGTYLKQSGHFTVEKPHAVVLRRGPGTLEGSPTVATLRHGAGRVTYSSVEPWYGEPPGFWLVQALIRWAARGAPVTAADLAAAPPVSVTPNSKEERGKKLEIVDVKYGLAEKPVNITPAVIAAAKSGLLIMISDCSLIGGDPKFGTPKSLYLRYRLNGLEEFRIYGENQSVVLDARPGVSPLRGDNFKLVEVRYGVGLYHPTRWIDVTQRFRPLVRKNGLNLTVEERDKLVSDIPDPAFNVPKSLVIHYHYQGRDAFAAFGAGSALSVGDPLVETK